LYCCLATFPRSSRRTSGICRIVGRTFLLIAVRTQCFPPSCHSCFHLAIIFTFMAVKICFSAGRRWRSLSDEVLRYSHSRRVFCNYEIIRRVNLISYWASLVYRRWAYLTMLCCLDRIVGFVNNELERLCKGGRRGVCSMTGLWLWFLRLHVAPPFGQHRIWLLLCVRFCVSAYTVISPLPLEEYA
jgi:hypothetical protein